jgi:hypothetical protein
MKIPKCFYIIFLTFFLFNQKANGEIIKLLELPSGLGGWLTYTIDAPFKCSFDGVKEVIPPDFLQESQDNLVLDKINFFQRKLNLELNKLEISPEKISFEIKGAKNITFVFYHDNKKKDCPLVRELVLENQHYQVDKIDIEYNNFLLSPVLEKLTVKHPKDSKRDLFLYPWALRGQMSSYEFNLGPAFSIHSNIRNNNQINFQTTNPVIEPIPAVFFRYGPFFLNQDGLGSLVFNWGDVSILALMLFEGEPYKTSGIESRTRGVYIGSIAKLDMLQVVYYKDFFSQKGSNLKATLAPEFYPSLSWRISPQFSVQYWNNQYVNYFYGVKPNESATSGFREYVGKKTLNYAAMLETVHYVNKWTFVNAAGMKFYGKEVYQSPTVTRKNELRFVTSILYKIF